MIAITGQDILDALGIPPASATDTGWADRCAAAANAFVNDLPIAALPEKDDQTLQGGTMLGVALYKRRPSGLVSGDADAASAAAVDGTIARLLRLGFYQKPVFS